MSIRSVSLAALLTSVAAIASVSATQAADLAVYSAAPSIAYSDAGLAVATDTWTGFYAGAHVGGATSDDFDKSNTAWTGGIQAGYLQQFDMFVVGAEVEGSLSDSLNYVLTPNAGLKQNWTVAAKARAGVNLGQTLVYGALGASLTELEGTGTTTSGSKTHAGVAFGAGVEQALTDNISVRAEYLQTRYFDVESTVAGAGRSDDLTNHALKVGVNYRF